MTSRAPPDRNARAAIACNIRRGSMVYEPTVGITPLPFQTRGVDTARLASEFYGNAINVMRGAEALSIYAPIPEAEKFRIEYWALEEAKLQRMPPERELSRTVAVVVGGGSGCTQQTDTEGDGCPATQAIVSSPSSIAISS